MLQCFCWSQGCWWQGLSQAVVWASLGSGSCLQVLSQALLSSSFDFGGKGCTIMAASICFTKIRLWSKFSPWCTIAKGGFSCSSSAHADEQDQLHTSTFPRMLLKPEEMQSMQSYLTTWPSAISEDCHHTEKNAAPWHRRAADPIVQSLAHAFDRGNTCSLTSCVSLAPLK